MRSWMGFALAVAVAGAMFGSAAPAWGATVFILSGTGELGQVDVATGVVLSSPIDADISGLQDIAFSPDGVLYGITFTRLMRIDQRTGITTEVGPHGISNGNAIVFGSDGTLFATGGNETDLFRLNRYSGEATRLGSIGIESEKGALAFMGDSLYVGSSNDVLYRIDLSVGTWGTRIGSIGWSDVRGLCSDAGRLYAISSTTIIELNPATGRGTEVSNYSGWGLGSGFGSSFINEAVVLGACCGDGGICSQTIASQCGAGGVWQGARTACVPSPCPQAPPTAACCGPGGECSLTAEVQCPAGSTWHADWTTCDPSPCPFQFDTWQPIIVGPGAPVRFNVDVPPGTPDLFVLVKKTTKIGYAGTWDGSLGITFAGNRLKYVSGSTDFGVQIAGPVSGRYQVEIQGLRVGAGQVMVTDTLPELVLGEWTTGEVLRPYGSDWKQVDVPAGLQSITFQTEGVGLHSTLEVYRGSLAQPEGYWHFGEGYSVKGTIASPPPGRYYLRYTDSAVMLQTGGDQNRQYMIVADTQESPPAPCTAKQVLGLSCTRVSTGTRLNLRLAGVCLESDDAVLLRREGQSDIEAGPVRQQDGTGRTLDAILDLTGAAPGEWVLWVVGRSGEAAAPDPLVVESSGEADLWVDIVCRRQLRVGRDQTVIVRYGNRGTAPSEMSVLALTLPGNCTITTDLPRFPSRPGASGAVQGGGDLMVVGLGSIVPGEEGAFSLKMRPDQTGAESVSASLIGYSITVLPTRSGTASRGRAGTELAEGSQGRTYPPWQVPPVGSIVFRTAPDGKGPGHVGVFVGLGPGEAWEVVHLTPIDFKIDFELGVGRFRYEVQKHSDIRKNWEIGSTGRTDDYGDYLGAWAPADIEIMGPSIVDAALRRVGEIGTYGWPQSDGPGKDCLTLLDELYNKWLPPQSLPVGLSDNLITPPQLYETLFEPLHWPDQGATFDMLAPSIFAQRLQDRQQRLNDLRASANRVVIRLSLALRHWLLQFIKSGTPEDKYGPSGYAAVAAEPAQARHFIPDAGDLFYRVDFWNREDATAPAAVVSVVDTLDANLDPATLAFTEVGFREWTVPLEGGSYFNVDVDMSPTEPYLVNVEGTYDPVARAIAWTFRTLDRATRQEPEDPMAGFLPAITDAGTEIGWVDFTISPIQGLKTGDLIRNQAFVNFDGQPNPAGLYWAPAPKAGPWTNVLDFSPPTSQVAPLPGISYSHAVVVRVGGEDEGSGIERFEIYASQDGGPFEYAGGTDTTVYAFSAVNGASYRFYSIAVDHVGNREAAPADGGFDASTTVQVLAGMAVAPSPFVPSRGHTFVTLFGANLAGGVVNFYDTAGDHVQRLVIPGNATTYQWDVRSRSGAPLASGVYIWVIEAADGGRYTGKFAVIR